MVLSLFVSLIWAFQDQYGKAHDKQHSVALIRQVV